LAVLLYVWQPGLRTIVAGCLILLVSWGITVWHIPWVRDAPWRRSVAFSLLTVAIALLGSIVWTAAQASQEPVISLAGEQFSLEPGPSVMNEYLTFMIQNGTDKPVTIQLQSQSGFAPTTHDVYIQLANINKANELLAKIVATGGATPFTLGPGETRGFKTPVGWLPKDKYLSFQAGKYMVYVVTTFTAKSESGVTKAFGFCGMNTGNSGTFGAPNAGAVIACPRAAPG